MLWGNANKRKENYTLLWVFCFKATDYYGFLIEIKKIIDEFEQTRCKSLCDFPLLSVHCCLLLNVVWGTSKTQTIYLGGIM